VVLYTMLVSLALDLGVMAVEGATVAPHRLCRVAGGPLVVTNIVQTESVVQATNLTRRVASFGARSSEWGGFRAALTTGV